MFVHYNLKKTASEEKTMILYGASGHAKVIIDILEANGQKIDFIVDDNPALTELLGYEVRRNTGE